MIEGMLNTKEVAQYLGIHEKQVYALIKAKKMPATRITGKWIFPKKLIDDWIMLHAQKGLEQAKQKSRKIEGALLASGSNDPLLDMLQTYLKKSYPEFYIFSANTGSTAGLKALQQGYTDMAWSHLYDPKSETYNIPFLSSYLPDIEAVVVNLFRRELGLIAAAQNPLAIHGFEDLARQGVRFINRQKGAGTRVLLDLHLQKLGIQDSAIRGYENEVYTHFEVGLAVLAKEADVGLATAAIARLLGLAFIPVTWESFDMILSQATFFERGVQALLEVLHSETFRSKVGDLGGYDFAQSGKILHS
jgi:excisionase family DNA binding protein